MNNLIVVRCKCPYYKMINKLNYLSINIYTITYKDGFIEFKINYKDYPKLKKYLPSYSFEIIKRYGFIRIKSILIKHYYYFLSLIIGFLTLMILSNIIVNVQVVHSSKRIRNLVSEALAERGIKRLSLKKEYQELSRIKEDILKEYPDDLEWIEIENHGMKYVVRVEQRVITKPKKNKNACNIVANKAGVITDIITEKGDAIVTRGSYVNKGDLLINGNISLNDEIKNTVCAKGTIKAEVWYTVKVNMPLKYQISKETKRKRYNIAYDKGLGKQTIFGSKYNNYKSYDKKLFSFFNTSVYFRTEKELKIITKRYNKEEALNKAIMLALEKINIKKKNKDKVITQKVLKNTINDSTINLEIFFAVEEEIGKEQDI